VLALYSLHNRLPGGTLPLGESPWICIRHPLLRPVMGRLDLPDPPRDEDYCHDDDVVSSEEHHCVVLTPDWWMCEDCGVSFPRDPSLGDHPETAIIEGGAACVAYVPEPVWEGM